MPAFMNRFFSPFALQKQGSARPCRILASCWVPGLRPILWATLFCLFLVSLRPAYAGRSPRVYGATFASTYTIYALDPELLAGWNGPLREYEKEFIPRKYQDLPVLGGWYGQGFFPDREKLASAGIDKVMLVTSDTDYTTEILRSLQEIGLPVLAVRGRTMDDYPPLFRESGKGLGMPERGEALAAYAERIMAETAAMLGDIPDAERVRVYLAQEVDGLGTVCDESYRSELVHLAGGVNVHSCPGSVSEASIRLSFEQVMLYDPDVVLILHPTFVERYPKDSKWQSLRAAREGKVFFVPHEPFSWMDKPSTYMRLIALPWLACTLHPKRCDKNMVEETKIFMRLFFDLSLDDAAARLILKQ